MSTARRCQTPLAAKDLKETLVQLKRATVQPFELYADDVVGESPEACRAAVDQISAILKVRVQLRHARQTCAGNGMLRVASAMSVPVLRLPAWLLPSRAVH